jgi:hypothetical protein
VLPAYCGNQSTDMFQNIGEHVRECLRRADESAERAKHEPNPSLQQDFVEMEGRWLRLALSYQFLVFEAQK